MMRALRYVLFYSVLIGVWALLAKMKIWPPYLFPTPWGVGEAMWAGFLDHSFWIAMVLGDALSVVLGMFLGLGLASNKFLEETVGGLLVSLQSLPSICWLPIAVLWFGLTEKAILFVVVKGSLLSETISMETGRKQLPTIYSMAGRTLGAGGRPHRRRQRLAIVLACHSASQLAVHRDGSKAGMGLRVEIADLR